MSQVAQMKDWKSYSRAHRYGSNARMLGRAHFCRSNGNFFSDIFQKIGCATRGDESSELFEDVRRERRMKVLAAVTTRLKGPQAMNLHRNSTTYNKYAALRPSQPSKVSKSF